MKIKTINRRIAKAGSDHSWQINRYRSSNHRAGFVSD